MHDILQITSNKLTSRQIGHLGLVAGIIDELGITGILDKDLPKTQDHTLSHSDIIKAMIPNGLEFNERRVYLFTRFFDNIATEQLFGPGVTPDHFTDDTILRILDRIYKHGSDYAGIPQKWVRAYFEKRRHVKEKTYARNLEKHISDDTDFAYEPDARMAAEKWFSEHSFLSPEKIEVIEQEKAHLGRFVVATNDLDLDAELVLYYYTGQQSMKRGFRSLKDNSFHADKIFLKKRAGSKLSRWSCYFAFLSMLWGNGCCCRG